MIKLKTLKWSNMFSYGPDNFIDFSENKLTQLVGANGSGKSSIPLILEEVLTNTNSKGTKKSDILNRYLDVSTYYADLEFEKNEDTYLISIKRGSVQTVKLYKNGQDISMHTATKTYELIKDITDNSSNYLSQIMYQQSANSLEFLSATDGLRKKFLVNLFGLDYDKYYENFKQSYKEENEVLIALKAKYEVVKQRIDSFDKSMELKEFLPIASTSDSLRDNIKLLELDLANIQSINAKIQKNNQFKIMLRALDTRILSEPVPAAESGDTAVLSHQIGSHQTTIKAAKTSKSKLESLGNECPTCLQAISNIFKADLLERSEEEIKQNTNLVSKLETKLIALKAALESIAKRNKIQAEFETLSLSIDASISDELLSQESIAEELKALKETFNALNSQILYTQKLNNDILIHNARVTAGLEIYSKDTQMLKTFEPEITKTQKLVSALDILKKTFGPNGFVAYKLENTLVDLENITNEYLATMSSGRFQLSFKVQEDKLNVFIIDNGKSISINALSTGEKARVNTSALLAIRKLMSSISTVKLNLLILDETLENLDIQGKELLIDILLEEQELNTFIISHSFSHPLISKIHIIKENNISRVANE